MYPQWRFRTPQFRYLSQVWHRLPLQQLLRPLSIRHFSDFHSSSVLLVVQMPSMVTLVFPATSLATSLAAFRSGNDKRTSGATVAGGPCIMRLNLPSVIARSFRLHESPRLHHAPNRPIRAGERFRHIWPFHSMFARADSSRKRRPPKPGRDGQDGWWLRP